jgi:hypothetical protein
LRVVVFLLILANLLFYAFAGGYFGRPENPDAGRVGQQLAADRLRIVGHDQKPPPKGNGERQSADAERTDPEELCLLWDHLPAADADRLASSLAEKFAGVRVERRVVAAEGAGAWVMVPPLGSKAEAERKAAEFKGLGVSDMFIIQEAGPNQYAISLGVFSSEKGGQDRLAELKAKGVRSARLMPRPGKESQFQVEARGPLANKTEVQEFAGGIVAKKSAQACK